MNIQDVLTEAYWKHERTHIGKFTAVYLGSREEHALTLEMEKLPSVPQQIAGDPPRRTWRGLAVYRVDAEHHIAFAELNH